MCSYTLLLFILSVLFVSSASSFSFFLFVFFYSFLFHFFFQTSQELVCSFRIFFINAFQIYATIASDCFLIFIFINLLSLTIRESIALFTFKQFIHSYVLYRHRLLNSLTWSDLVIQFIYIAFNALCLDFKSFTLWKVTFWTEKMTLINLISLFVNFHLSFLINIFDFRLNIYRRVHYSTNLMLFALLLFYILIVVIQRTLFFVKILKHFYERIVYF